MIGRESVGEVSRIQPEPDSGNVVIELPNCGIDRNEVFYANIAQAQLDELCVYGIRRAVYSGKSPNGLYYLRNNFGNGLIIDPFNEPVVAVRRVFFVEAPDTYCEKPYAGIDTTISYFGSHEFLQFRKWSNMQSGKPLWALSNREPLEEYPLPGSDPWSGFKIIEACSHLTFQHPYSVTS